MDRQSRDLNWSAVERAFTDNRMPIGTPCPIAVMVEVKTEDGTSLVGALLNHDGFQVASVEKKWWPFGRRWRIAAKLPTPQPITRPEIDRWLDRLDNQLKAYDAAVASWIPIKPGA
jgi:hypothetical protein